MWEEKPLTTVAYNHSSLEIEAGREKSSVKLMESLSQPGVHKSGSYLAQAGLCLLVFLNVGMTGVITQLALIWNLPSSCLSALSAVITSMKHHALVRFVRQPFLSFFMACLWVALTIFQRRTLSHHGLKSPF